MVRIGAFCSTILATVGADSSPLPSSTTTPPATTPSNSTTAPPAPAPSNITTTVAPSDWCFGEISSVKFQCEAGTQCCGSRTLTPSCIYSEYNTCCEYKGVAVVCAKGQQCGELAGLPTCLPFGSTTPAPAPSNVTTTAAPAPAPSNVTTTAAPAPAPSNVTTTAAPAPAPSNVTTTAAPAPAPSNVTTTAAPAPAPSNVTTTAAPAPAPSNVTTTATPAPSNVTTTSTPAPSNVTTTATPAPSNVTTTAPPSDWCFGEISSVKFHCLAGTQCCGSQTLTPSCIYEEYNTCCEYKGVAVVCAKGQQCGELAGLPTCLPFGSTTPAPAPSNVTTTSAPAPSNSTTSAPSNSTTSAPSNSTTSAPSNSTTSAPSISTTSAPSNSTTLTPTTASPFPAWCEDIDHKYTMCCEYHGVTVVCPTSEVCGVLAGLPVCLPKDGVIV